MDIVIGSTVASDNDLPHSPAAVTAAAVAAGSAEPSPVTAVFADEDALPRCSRGAQPLRARRESNITMQSRSRTWRDGADTCAG